MRRRTATGSEDIDARHWRALVGSVSVVSTRTAVVFPAPFGPSRPQTGRGGHQVHAASAIFAP